MAVDLGPLRPTDDATTAQQVIGRLTSAVLDQAAALVDAGANTADLTCLGRVTDKVVTARAAILGPVP